VAVNINKSQGDPFCSVDYTLHAMNGLSSFLLFILLHTSVC